MKIGLDIGSASTGWCVWDEKNEIILGAGSYIFPIGLNESTWKGGFGSEESKNVSRRNTRMTRRLLYRYKLRRDQLKKILLENGLQPDPQKIYTTRALYSLRKEGLDRKIDLKDFGKILLLLNSRRGFKSSKKDKSGDKEKSLLVKSMNDLELKIKDSGCRTIGEYFYSLFLEADKVKNWHNQDEPIQKIRGHHVLRRMYEDEFDQLWDKQSQYHKNLTTELKKDIKERCIYYQRPLKSAKHLVSNCVFETRKKALAASHPLAQEFRLWQKLADLKVSGYRKNGQYREFSSLTLEEKHTIAKYLTENKKISEKKFYSILGLDTEASSNISPKDLIGLRTYCDLGQALGFENFSKLHENGDGLSKERLWHTLYFATDSEWLEEYAVKKFGLSSAQAKAYSQIDLEDGYGKISHKALRGIVEHLKVGHSYSSAVTACNYDFKNSISYNPENLLVYDQQKDNLRNPMVTKASVEVYRLVNDLMKKFGRPDEIRIEMARQLQLPKNRREKIMSENKRKQLLRDQYRKFLREKLGKSHISKGDLLKFELWLELQFNETDLNQLLQNKSIDLVDFEKFKKEVKETDNVKFKLWLECNRVSPYTGKVISLSKLFAEDSPIQIEHIIPYSLCQDDSFSNKTLCEIEFNQAKGNKTPIQYLSEIGPKEVNAFKYRVTKTFQNRKRDRLLIEEFNEGSVKSFRSDSLNITSYVTNIVKGKLSTVCPLVTVSNGQVSSLLRKFWGVNSLLNSGDKKERNDHRHHAVDAIVVACTTNSHIKKLSTEAKLGQSGLKVSNFQLPSKMFLQDAKWFLDHMLIPFRKESKLIVSKSNKYQHSKSKETKKQKTLSVRGSLHNDTFYGKIKNPHINETGFATRKPLTYFTSLKQLEDVIDPVVREQLLNHANKYADAKGALKKNVWAEPVFMKTKDELKKIPIKKVRIFEKDTGSKRAIRTDLNGKSIYAEPSDNYMFAIYGELVSDKGKTKRTYITLPFWDAVKNKKSNQLLVPANKSGLPLLCTLQKKDAVICYKDHPDEINRENRKELFDRLFIVVKTDQNGNIILSRHYLSGTNANTAKPITSLSDHSGQVIRSNANTFKGIKVKVSSLGEVIWPDGYITKLTGPFQNDL